MYEQLSLDCFISLSIKYQRNNIFNNLSLCSVLSATFYHFNFLVGRDLWVDKLSQADNGQ